MGSVAGPAAAVGTGLSLVSGVMQGEGTKAADEMQSAELSEKAQLGQAAAVETNANSVEKLNSSLGNIDAVRAASGDSPSSPTGSELRSTTASYSNEQRAIKVGNILSQSEMDTAGANYMQQAGSFAMTQGVLGGMASAAGILAKTNPGTFGLPGTG